MDYSYMPNLLKLMIPLTCISESFTVTENEILNLFRYFIIR